MKAGLATSPVQQPPSARLSATRTMGPCTNRGFVPLLLAILYAGLAPCAFAQTPSCTLTPTNGGVSLTAIGTASAGGVAPEIPQSTAIATAGSCDALMANANPTYVGPGICGLPTNLPNLWLTASASGGTVTFVALSNAANFSRTGTITIGSASGASNTFTVTESADGESATIRVVRALYQTIAGPRSRWGRLRLLDRHRRARDGPDGRLLPDHSGGLRYRFRGDGGLSGCHG